jgi:hypothetical protein
MLKDSKRKLLFVTVILVALLISTAYATLAPSVRAAQATSREKGLSILKNVVDLDLTKYMVTVEEAPKDSQISYFDVAPQEDVGYELMSSNGKLKTLCTFVDGKLQMLHVLETEGQPSLTKPATSANAVEMAKNFLKNYQAYTADALYGELKSTLDSIGVGKNVTKTSGNTQLEMTVAG